MQIPRFPETNHPLVQPLFHHSDLELLTLLQQHPEQGKYFTAIFCRYSPLIYTIIRHSARSRIQSDYLFAMIWRHLYYEMQSLNPEELETVGDNSLQSWLIKMAGVTLNQVELPPVESINYDLQAAPPPLWCHLEIALNKLPPIVRLMVLMAQTFHWSEARIAGYLQQIDEPLTVEEVKSGLEQGYQLLETALPDDIRMIYLYHESYQV
ncbi:hypothetical protein [Dactylococcopsis salina]|uniref:Uncharacterized protein n=1 Tax=Dactylococcopsis salina (strain PCC 8305) TaxID=13035 RepID=K9YXT3_DACS8|nr:hypothetical protein [Dactylococcopsis salina]AFZ51746.1 hypothetical protein Dacsa_3227 [Dactylococcopsis salina PCC 8305]